MKKIYIITLFLSITLFGHTQLDTSFQQTTTEYGHLEIQQLVDAKQHYLQLQKDERYLFKVGFQGNVLPTDHPSVSNSLPNAPISNSIFLAFEHRLKAGFSINVALDYNRFSFTTIRQIFISRLSSAYAIHHYGFHIEPRWYFKKKQQIKQQKSGNNLSGLYLSILAGTKYWQKPYPIFNNDGKLSFLKGQYQYSTLNVGWQRRFGKHGFFHLQLGTGIQKNPQNIIQVDHPSYGYEIHPLSKWKWISTYKIGVGLALSNKSDTNIEQKIWTYHESDRDMWKVDLFGLLFSLGQKEIGSKINIGYEKGSKNSSFSINTNIIYLHQYAHELSFQIAPRYYYNLKKRMQKGKTANNLSADYFSIRNQWNIIGGSPFLENKFAFSLLWGTQRRVFEKMFINYEFGYQFPSSKYIIYENQFLSELKVGLAF